MLISKYPHLASKIL